MHKIVIYFILIFLPSTLFSQVVINEFMSSNDNTIVDENGDSSDWIELFNKGGETVSLSNYYLSDKADNLQKWKFPDIEILPQAYLLVFCSGKDKREVDMPLHTNFKLSAAGEDLFLLKDYELLQRCFPVVLASDYSYAAIPDGGQDFFITSLPSPGQENELLLPLDIDFSVSSGFYDQTISLELNLDSSLENVEIRYTKNGDIPDSSALLYEQLIIIEDRTNEENSLAGIPTTPDYSDWTEEPTYPGWQNPQIKQAKGTVIRAAAFIGEKRISEIFTHTYFVFPEGQKRFSLPALSISCPNDSLFGEERGIYVPGIFLDTENIVWSGNYFKSGEDWERISNVEYFVNGENVINQTVGLRIHGGKTRGAAQKTLKIFARSEYGKKRMEYPFFKNKDQDSYKRLLVRTSMASWAHCILTDAFAHQMVKGLHLDIQEYQPVIVFINGEYWGLHELREKIDRYKIAEDHDLDEDSIRIYGSWGGVIEGETDGDFYRFRDDYLTNNDIRDPAVYEYVTTQIDIDNLIDYFFSEIYLHNPDWPANNLRMWRSAQFDNKWRWLYYDLDGCFGGKNIEKKNMEQLLDDSSPYKGQDESATKIIRTLIKNETFKNEFIDRAKYLLTHTFSSRKLIPLLIAMQNEYEGEIDEHFLRWENWLSEAEWHSNIKEHMEKFLMQRSCAVEAQMVDYFGVEKFLNCDEGISAIRIYPNPANGLINIELESDRVDSFHCRIYNNLGQILHNQLILSNFEQQIDISSFPSGIYYLSIFNVEGNEISTKKIINQ
ncbi:MAG: T9SS type A sorting domain-containing protein [Bacteroidetes bacterium]|nr:T9SS type A sorting domain-containing protein [Bacteroidota bacterium]